MKVLFVQLAHAADDDRVLYHQSATLERHGIHTAVIARETKPVPFMQHLHEVRRRIREEHPDVVICDLPKAVLASVGCGASVVYDITEWYPNQHSIGRRSLATPFRLIGMAALNYLAGMLTDRFIFGERDKGRPFRRLFPWKRYVELPYYPSSALFPVNVSEKGIGKQCNILYAGPLTTEKGWGRVQETLELCRAARPDIVWNLTTVEPNHFVPLPEFCRSLKDIHIALDLREINAENRRCLPIKLFYYMAAGCAPVYSDLDAIRNGVPGVESFCALTHSAADASEAILRLVNDPQEYSRVSSLARHRFVNAYNWELIENRLLSILQ